VSNINEDIRDSIVGSIPDAVVHTEGSGGHFVIEVTSQVFEGKSLLQKQRLVYRSIKDLMAGDAAPVHAVDKLITKLPGE
jgi:acid stress-induced BolA-like protein IbaG/YrbA